MSVSAPTSSVSYDTHVAKTIAELILAAFPSGLRAVVLTGSLARGEGTWLNSGSRVRLAGDADFLGVFDDHGPLPPPDGITRLKRLAEERLASAGVDAHVGLSPVSARYLQRLPPDIYSYELITNGKVIWGDPHTLKLAPAFAASEIPIDDGFRLLMNRMIELLEIVCEHEKLAASVSIPYRAMKLWLDMATSYLLFEREYVPTYRGRAARLCELSAQPSTIAPIPMRSFARMVALATRCKLAEIRDSAMSEFTDLTTLIDAAHSLWRWELERLTLRSASDRDLRDRWLADEPVAGRMRGWAAVLARAGAARVIARMPAWIVLARRGSPRRLVYDAASELLFAIPQILEDKAAPGMEARWDKLRRRLPVTDSPENRSSQCSWRRLGHAIAFNYNSFLVPTRS